MNRLRLKTSKTFWQVSALQLTVVVLLFALLFTSSSRILSENAKEEYKMMTDSTTIRMHSQVSVIVRYIEQLERDIQTNPAWLSNETKDLNETVKQLVLQSEIVNGATLVDTAGDVLGYYPGELATVKNLKEREYVQEALSSSEIYFGDVVQTVNNGRSVLVVSIPILRDQETVRAVNLAVHLNNNSLFQSMFDNTQVGTDGYVYLVDRNGTIIYHPKSARIGDNAIENEVVQQVLKGKAGYQQVTNTEGTEMLASYRFAEGVDWGIVAQVPVSAAYQTAEAFQQVLTPLAIAVMAVLLGILLLATRRILSPLKKLHKAADRLASGQYSGPITGVDERTEIGAVVSSFNEMQNALQTAEISLRQQQAFLQKIINHLPSAVYVVNREGKHRLVNDAYAHLLGKSPEELLGQSEQQFIIDPAQAAAAASLNREVIESGKMKDVETALLDSTGDKRHFHIVKVPVSGTEGTQLLCVMTDITMQKQRTEQIRYQANHDELTGLPNRKRFNEVLQIQLSKAERKKTPSALLFLDLDRFKYVNDTYGHDAGDALLRMVARRLVACAGNDAWVFRLGGDEFTVILPNLKNPQEAEETAAAIVQAIREPFPYGSDMLHVTASVGVSFSSEEAKTIDTLTRQADQAMYHAKQQGKNKVALYSETAAVRQPHTS